MMQNHKCFYIWENYIPTKHTFKKGFIRAVKPRAVKVVSKE